MERREPGRLANAPGHGRLLLWTLGYTLVAFALLSMQRDAFAAQLVDVRVGEHKGYTRLVLELDSLAAYQVSEPREGADPVMRVELDARGTDKELAPTHPIVKSVRVEASGRSTSIHVNLAKAEVQINEMILLSPPRLVFDIRDPAAAASKSVAQPAAAKTAELAAVKPSSAKPAAAKPAVAKPVPAKPVVAKPPAASVPAKASEPLAAATPPATPKVAEAPSPPPARAPTPITVKAQVPPQAPAAGAPRVRHSGEDADPTVADAKPGQPSNPTAQRPGRAGEGQAPGHPLAVQGAATGRPNALAVPPTRADAPAAGPDTPASRAVPPLPSQRRAAAAGDSSTPSGEKGVVAKAKSFAAGINKIVLAGVGVVVALLLFFVIRRGRSGHDALSPVMAADHLGGEADELFGGPDDSAATEPVPTNRSTPSTAAPPPPPEVSPPPQGDGKLESRVAQLEAALTQLTQARENMERQLAAQTEELRVQRAAIARTQRVVRSFGEGEEEPSGATEPVPRMPAS